MSKTALDFSIDLDRFGAETEEQILTIYHKIALDLDSAVVLSTPVDTGRARGNWFPSLNSPVEFFDNEARDPSGQLAIARINDVVARAQLGTVIWMSNNLPYIVPLENGHSKQAPAGMVDINVSRFAAAYGASVTR